jgi:hypothetical protein
MTESSSSWLKPLVEILSTLFDFLALAVKFEFSKSSCSYLLKIAFAEELFILVTEE